MKPPRIDLNRVGNPITKHIQKLCLVVCFGFERLTCFSGLGVFCRLFYIHLWCDIKKYLSQMAEVFRSCFLQGNSKPCERSGPFCNGSFQWCYSYRHPNSTNPQYYPHCGSGSNWWEWNYPGWSTDYAVNRLVWDGLLSKISIAFNTARTSPTICCYTSSSSPCWDVWTFSHWFHFPLFFFVYVCLHVYLACHTFLPSQSKHNFWNHPSWF